MMSDTQDGDGPNMCFRSGYLTGLALADAARGLTDEDREMLRRAARSLLIAGTALMAPSARPRSEWHEDDGVVLWWKLPVDEPPYVGTELDEGFPDYMTHWTPLPQAPVMGTESESAPSGEKQ